MEVNINKIVEKIEQIQQIKEDLPDEYYYTCLPLCLIDAIFSIGAKYKSTKNAVVYFAENNGIHLDRRTGASDYTIDDFLARFDECNSEDFSEVAKHLFNNRQMTSTKNGIRKAEAVKRCALVFQKHGIQTIQDFQKKMTDKIESQYKEVPGQGSGISLTYLKMLSGNDKLIKPDRHVLRFFDGNYEDKNDREQAQKIVNQVVIELKPKYPDITARKVDYMIWNYMSNR